MRRSAEITNCGHTDRKHYAKGRCRSCYNAVVGRRGEANKEKCREWYEKQHSQARTYGDGITVGRNTHIMIVLNNPDGTLDKGSRFLKQDFLIGMVQAIWPVGLEIKNEYGTEFEVGFEMGLGQILIRQDKARFKISTSGEDYSLVRIHGNQNQQSN